MTYGRDVTVDSSLLYIDWVVLLKIFHNYTTWRTRFRPIFYFEDRLWILTSWPKSSSFQELELVLRHYRENCSPQVYKNWITVHSFQAPLLPWESYPISLRGLCTQVPNVFPWELLVLLDLLQNWTQRQIVPLLFKLQLFPASQLLNLVSNAIPFK